MRVRTNISSEEPEEWPQPSVCGKANTRETMAVTWTWCVCVCVLQVSEWLRLCEIERDCERVKVAVCLAQSHVSRVGHSDTHSHTHTHARALSAMHYKRAMPIK